jgi:hypothetical protein
MILTSPLGLVVGVSSPVPAPGNEGVRLSCTLQNLLNSVSLGDYSKAQVMRRRG